jgi:hypothetical protein
MTEKPKAQPAPVSDTRQRLELLVKETEQQVNITDFNENFRARLDQMHLTKEEMAELSLLFERSKVERIRNDARNVIAEKVQQERQELLKSINPANWKPETQRAALLATGGVVAGGTALYFLGKMLGGATEKVRKTASTIRSGMMWLTGGLIVAAGAGLGIAAWKHRGEIMQSVSAIKKAGDFMKYASGEQFEKMQKTITDAQEQAEKTIADMRAQMELMSGEARAAMEKNVEKMQKTIDDATAKATEKAKAVLPDGAAAVAGLVPKPAMAEVPAAETSTAPAEAPIPPQTSAPGDKGTAEKFKEQGKETAESIVLNFLGDGLTLLHADLALKAGFDVREKTNDAGIINGVLNLKDVRSKTLGEMALIGESGTYEEAKSSISALLGNQKLQEPEMRAIYFLALVAKAQRGIMRAPEGVNPDDMSIESMLDQTSGIARLLSRTKEKMLGVDLTSPADIARRLMDVYSGNTLEEDLASSASVQEEMQKLGLAKEDIAGFAAFCAQKSNTLISSAAMLEATPEQQKYIDALQKLRSEMMDGNLIKNEIGQYIELFAHGQEEFLPPLRERIASMNIGDALQLYLCLNKARDEQGKLPENLTTSHPHIALMMQMKILSMIGSVDKYQGEKLKAFLTLQTGEAGASALINGQELPASLKEMMPLVGGIVTNVAKDKLGDATDSASAWVSETDKKYPWAKYVAGGLGIDYVARKLSNWRAHGLSRTLENTVFGKGYTAFNRPTAFQWVRGKLPLIGTVESMFGNADMAARTKTFAELGTEAGVPASLDANPAARVTSRLTDVEAPVSSAAASVDVPETTPTATQTGAKPKLSVFQPADEAVTAAPAQTPRARPSTIDEGGPVRQAANVIDEVPTAPKPALKLFNPDVAETATEISQEAQKLIDEIADARMSSKSIGTLAKNVDLKVLNEAAKHSEDALALEKSINAAKASNAVRTGAVALEVFVTLYLIYENRQRMDVAAKAGDQDTVRILQSKQRSLALAGTGGVAATLGLSSFAVAGPAAIALAGGSMYADHLYEHAISLNKGTVRDYLQTKSTDLVHDMDVLRSREIAGIATGRGPETRMIRRQGMMEAYLLKKVPVFMTESDVKEAEEWMAALQPVALQQRIQKFGSRENALRDKIEEIAYERHSRNVNKGMAAARYLTNGEFLIPEKGKNERDPLSTGRALATMYELKEKLQKEGAPLIIEYSADGGTIRTVDLAQLPDGLSGKESAAEWNKVIALVDQFNEYKVAHMRDQYLVLGEAKKDNWKEASDFLRKETLERWSDAIAIADARIEEGFFGRPGKEFMANAARIEARKKVQKSVMVFMASAQNDENSLAALVEMDKNIQNALRNIDPMDLYDKAQSNKESKDFNIIKYSLTAPSPNFMTATYEGRIKGVLAAENFASGELGVPVKQALTSLISR